MEVVSYENFLPWIKAHYAVAVLMANLALVFVLAFTHKDRIYGFIDKAILIALLTDILPAYMIFVKNSVITGASRIDGLININFGDGYPSYVYFLTLYFVAALVVLAKKYRSVAGVEKKQLRLVIIGSSITILVAFITNLVLPWLGFFKLFWAGPALVIFLALFFGYAITKYQLFNIKIVTTEITVFVVWVVILVEFLAAESLVKRIFEGGILVIVVVFGIMIIKSVLNEVKRREELEHLSSELSIANERLKELDKLKSDFVSIVSHQLRSPLTVIKGYTSMILEGAAGSINDTVKLDAKKVYESSERLIKFVNDLLDVSRIERGKMEYNLEETNICSVTRSVADEFKQMAADKNLTLELKLGAECCPKLKLDENKIRQVIVNLLDNAIKYTSRGGITVGLSADGRWVKVSIKDTGIGLDRKDIAKLFDKFARVEGVASANGTGTGLGLYVAREIARGHGGDVAVLSEGRGRGSTFILQLPV